MVANPRVLGYLGRALSHELAAVQQYLTHAGIAGLWGLEEAAAYFRREATEEQVHAQRLIERMLQLGAMPNGSRLTPVEAGPSFEALLEADRRLEQREVALYREAVDYCLLIGDRTNREFFAALYEEELNHLRELAAWLQPLAHPSMPLQSGGIDADQPLAAP